MKKLREISNILKNNSFTTNVKLYMSTKVSGDAYDSYEKNYTLSNLNPITIKGLVRNISPETAFYKGYGQRLEGAKEIITEKRYVEAFKNCNKIIIDDVTYQVFREGLGNNVSIIERTNDLIRVTVTRLD